MSGIIPDRTIDVLRTFNDLSVDTYGIDCTLYVPTNLTTLEPNDAYTDPTAITYKEYSSQKVWINWSAKNLERLRKLGVFAEGEAPITAYFKNVPDVTIKSYIVIDVRYIPDTYDTDSFEVVDVLMSNTYSSETYRWFKLAPRRKK